MDQITFESLNISQELVRSVHEMGFEYATDIQAQTIPLLLEGQDVIGRSQTGTGKTAAFGIPAIELIDGLNKTEIQVLVVSPTRELALQSWGEFKKLYKYKSGVKAAVIYGGQPIGQQIRELKKGVNVVIGTPGRIMDHMRRKTLSLSKLKMVILDEADEMLNMGFREDIETILNTTPKERQTIMFCATMPPEILAITKAYQKQPHLIELSRNNSTLAAIEQYYCDVSEAKKPEALIAILALDKPLMAIVFCNTQNKVDELCRYLNQNGFEAIGIHGRMRQDVRTDVMNSFKSGKASLLVATDIAARGIDVQDIETVINFDIPQNTENYVHRIGRTGRAGKSGKAFTIASGNMQMLQLRDIEDATKIKIVPQELKGFEYNQNTDTKHRISRDFINKSADKTDKNARGMDKKVEFKVDGEASTSFDTIKIEINIGRVRHIAPNHIVGAITEKTSLRGSDIGKIEILDKSSIVEIPASFKQEVMEAMQGSKIKGQTVDLRLFDEL